MQFGTLGDRVPVILMDDVYVRPREIREAALQLSYHKPEFPYPGRIARVEQSNSSLSHLMRWALNLVNKEYLSRVPRILHEGADLTALNKIYTDFAIVDAHPDELSNAQRIPHIDAVPVFGLIYLNPEPRGGTLFFQQTAEVDEGAHHEGYMTSTNSAFQVIGRIEAVFNRLAIYPGFILHSGDITGDWIKGDERFLEPRLTQRLVLQP